LRVETSDDAIKSAFIRPAKICRALFYGQRWANRCGARIRWRLFPANASYSDFSNARTPQNRLAGSGYTLLPIVVGHLRGGLTHFKLRAHFLDLRCLFFQSCSESLHSFLLLRHRGL
jgi:hypothetical protein